MTDVENTRPYKAGVAMAKSIIESVNSTYSEQTAEKFLIALNRTVVGELNRRTIKKMEVNDG